jgi:hypothetical protein
VLRGVTCRPMAGWEGLTSRPARRLPPGLSRGRLERAGCPPRREPEPAGSFLLNRPTPKLSGSILAVPAILQRFISAVDDLLSDVVSSLRDH